jgi:hypothetical protein
MMKKMKEPSKNEQGERESHSRGLLAHLLEWRFRYRHRKLHPATE